MAKFRKKSIAVEAITFDELVEYGKANGANIVNGMPWSFTYNDHPITHENDDCYLVNSSRGTRYFERGDMLLTDTFGNVSPIDAKIFGDVYEPVDPVKVSGDEAASIAGRLINCYAGGIQALTFSEATQHANDVRKLAASVLSQDETKGANT